MYKHSTSQLLGLELKHLQYHSFFLQRRSEGETGEGEVGWTTVFPKSFRSSSVASSFLSLKSASATKYLGYAIVRWWHTVCDRLHIVDQGRALLAVRIRASQIRSGRPVGASGTTLLSGRGRRCRCCRRPHFRK